MKCEFCDSVIKTVPDNGICPNCGGLLSGNCDNQKAKVQFLEPPIGLYTAMGDNYVEIGETYVRIFVKVAFFPDIDVTIPFSEIYAVGFEPKRGTMKPGFLCVRERNKRAIPLPQSTRESYKDSCAIRFLDNEKFFNVFLFLKNCADINNDSTWRKPD